MTTRYVDSANGSPSSPYTSWADAAQSLSDVAGVCSDGDVVLVDDGHSKIYTATTTINFPSVRIVSVDKADDTYAEGASEGTNASNYDFIIRPVADRDYIVIEGMTLTTAGSGDAVKLGNEGEYSTTMVLRNCTLASHDPIELLTARNSTGLMVFENCTFTPDSGVAIAIDLKRGGSLIIKSCSFGSNYAATCTFLNCVLNYATTVMVQDCDLTEFSTLVATWTDIDQVIIRRCRLAGSVDVVSGTLNVAARLTCEYCSDAELTATPLPLYHHEVYGGTCESTASVYRDSGASDGENTYSYKLAGGANCSELNPVDCPHPFAIRHDASGSKTLTVYLGSDDSGLLDNEVWAEVSFGDEETTTYATGEFVLTRPTYGNETAAGTSTYLKTDASSWTGAGPSTKYKIEVTGIDPEEPCWVTVKLFFATASKNLWACPKITLTAE